MVLNMFTVCSYLEQQSERGDDRLYVAKVGGSIWFCIADGAGGTGSGDRAGSYIIEAFAELTRIRDFNRAEDFESFLRKIDMDLVGERFGGEATAVLGKVENDLVLGASVGDSEAWLINSEYEYQLTNMQHAKPLLGSGNSIPIGFGPMPIDLCLLIGSDGLFKYSKHQDIRSQVLNGSTAAEIAALAKTETGKLQDDISVILIGKTEH